MKASRFILGLLFILAGTVFFLINFGYGSWSLLRLVPQFWPVLLIIFGLSLLWKGPIPPWFGFSFILALMTLVIYIFVLSPDLIDNSNFVENRQIKKKIIIDDHYPNISSGELQAQFSAGKILLKPTTTDSHWVEGYFNHDNVVSEHKVVNDRLKLDFRIKNRESSIPEENIWNLALSPKLKWKIHLKIGASSGELNLVEIPLQKLDLQMGAGEINLHLGDNGPHSKIKINAAASHIKLKLREEDGIKINLGGAVKSTNLPMLNWGKKGSYYVSPNYQTATNQIEAEFNLALGHLEIELIPADSLLDKAEKL